MESAGHTVTRPPGRCDLVVVGGGIVGLAVARELAARRPGASIAVLEREPRLAAHQTGHSSGVVHAGIYYRPGSLRARLCVEGARDLYAYCEERGIAFERSGKLIVAATEGELPRLDELERRGVANEVPGLRRVEAGEIAAIEPHARGLAALHSPATGVVDFTEVARSFAADANAAGVRVVTGCGVGALRPARGAIEVRHTLGTTSAGFVVACAGAWSDRLAVAAGAPEEPRIVPFRGGYLRLRPERRELVRASIYAVPDPDLPFLGAHATRGLDGDVLLGPSALMAGARDAYRLRRVVGADLAATLGWPGTWRLAARHWRAGLAEIGRAASRRAFVAGLRRYVPELSAADVVAGPAGVRAQALARDGTLVDDFVISETERALHVRNAPSPAATSSLALAREIADRVPG
ncbi:MAG TPA: L-2-hydroxyglutarate oxidase [Solirubrobacterales bacterium]